MIPFTSCLYTTPSCSCATHVRSPNMSHLYCLHSERKAFGRVERLTARYIFCDCTCKHNPTSEDLERPTNTDQPGMTPVFVISQGRVNAKIVPRCECGVDNVFSVNATRTTANSTGCVVKQFLVALAVFNKQFQDCRRAVMPAKSQTLFQGRSECDTTHTQPRGHITPETASTGLHSCHRSSMRTGRK